ncbi:MAG: hypothetical protein IPK66_16280 [Rhodospirillales bacterium]|nr:hypothetical protein [Rhodospirillales bacterium]
MTSIQRAAERWSSISEFQRDKPSLKLEICWVFAAFAVIATVGALKVPLPLHRDAATFLWLASRIQQGAVLYVDVWDVKQPGIFMFDLLAGRLFGFTAEGVHCFELLWHLTFAAVATIALRPSLRHPWLAVLGPAAALTSYYVFCQSHQQTQLEILVALPLFIVAWITVINWRSQFRRALGYFAAGIAAGIVTAFKHVLAPIPVAFLLAATFEQWRRRPGITVALVAGMWLPFILGVLVVWGGMAFAFWRLGAIDAFLTTTFVYPIMALEDVSQAPYSRLLIALAIFITATAPWLPYGAYAVIRWRRSKQADLTARMILWLVVGLGVILIQKSSWWTYHMLLLYAPVGILGARGVDLVVSRLRHGRAPGSLSPAIISVILVAPVLAALGYPAGETARPLITALAPDGAGIEAYRREASLQYAEAADAAAFLEVHAPPGPIYVFGDPTIHLLSGREQAIPQQGSAWDFYLPDQWRRLPDELRASRPVWVFIETPFIPLVAHNSPQTAALLSRDYHVVWETSYGRWYALRSADHADRTLSARAVADRNQSSEYDAATSTAVNASRSLPAHFAAN